MRHRRSIYGLSLGWVLMLAACEAVDEAAEGVGEIDAGPPNVDAECVPRDRAPTMPATATAYADLCSRLLGVVPAADCAEGVRIPITVDGVEVFETPRGTPVITRASRASAPRAAPFGAKRDTPWMVRLARRWFGSRFVGRRGRTPTGGSVPFR